MSFFKKVLASIGVGATKVDAVLKTDQLTVGEEIEGTLKLVGGEVEQEIDSIYLTINTEIIKEHDDKKYRENVQLSKYKLNDRIMIKPGQKLEIPFSIQLPLNTPLSVGATKVWVQTGLDIKSAIDPQDTDYLRVLPNELMRTVLDTVQDLGFRLRESENKVYYGKIVQEFEFVPVHGSFRGKLDELEVTFIKVSEHEIDLLVQVDRRAQGLGGLLSEAFNMDETNLHLTVSKATINDFKQNFEQVIRKYS